MKGSELIAFLQKELEITERRASQLKALIRMTKEANKARQSLVYAAMEIIHESQDELGAVDSLSKLEGSLSITHEASRYERAEKILEILHAENRFLHVREIARLLQSTFPGYSFDQVVKRISPLLSQLKKVPELGLICIAIGGKQSNTFWGFRSWLDDAGGVKATHIYNMNEVAFSKSFAFVQPQANNHT